MKKKRVVKIKNLKLKHFRDSLRTILKLAVYDQDDELRKESDKYKVGTPEMGEISDKQQRLQRALDQSICRCPVCGSTDSDMVFNPHDKYWYCPKCYRFNQEFYQRKGEGYLYP